MTSADPATVNATALEGAFDFVSAGAPCENGASMCMDTGRISWTSIAVDVEEENAAGRSGNLRSLHRSAAAAQESTWGWSAAAQELPGDHEAVEDCLRRQAPMAASSECRRAGDVGRTARTAPRRLRCKTGAKRPPCDVLRRVETGCGLVP